MKYMGSSHTLPVVKHLSKKEQELFFTVYANHNRSIGIEKRAEYTLASVVKVVSVPEEKCLHVHYADGEWWHYGEDGTWY